VVKNSLKLLDRGASRRGFLVRTGEVLAAAGLALGAQTLGADRAEARTCRTCCCTRCGCCTQTVGRCCSGYSYTGYTWVCCYQRTTALFCWDCRKSDLSTCYCSKSSSISCN
jgi:hypothetical protein